MAHLRAGWFVVLCGAVLAVSAWLPWLTTSVQGGGHASAIGGTVGSIVLPPRFGAGQLIVLLASTLVVSGAMVARGLSPRLAAVAAVVISVLIGVLTYRYYHLNVSAPVSAGYGFYIGAASAAGALVFSVWMLIAALALRR
ncbi:hypothetical protein BayCH28_13750 [Mycolicibacterium sp. CH28]|uniref:hypothetical protein n=1 Tax=Mycolicibacterium sp. CH28 TaxID=2512237 RepID=UPI00107FE383|nr:hypothetical protein [Mycolicibacterium sp. CH28]TGD87430.1 hypothetical protein BayCH28_13750 [Mycolicibacterium sp. CH28]